jgi:hypothetical protein
MLPSRDVEVGVGVGEGVGVSFTTLIMPTMPQHAPCGVQKYGNDPAVLNVCMKEAPWLRIPESHIPLGIPGEPEVLLCPLELHVQRTVSPG